MLTDIPSTARAMTATIELNRAETETLRDILERYLRDLSYEIANTDSSAFKEAIKAHRGSPARSDRGKPTQRRPRNPAAR